ncbi:hypothetical protein [Dysgonomonas termitidis]|uniref:Phage morphogenesis protein n=1 Tax=Dysgonomonas termitidis TaxID=1516126 RepID=A0ABV9KRN0_9BACT
MKITLEIFCRQWVKDKRERTIVSRFEKNIFDFTTIAGNRSRMFFQASFNTGGFFRSGSGWRPRESRWGKKFTHPVLIDTGMLGKSVKGEVRRFESTNYQSRRGFSSKIFRRGAKYDIWTAEESFPIKGKRGRKGKYKSYAAIHNSDPGKTGYTVNQYSGKKPVQRQFIGFSEPLDKDVSRYIDMIFKGFPHA